MALEQGSCYHVLLLVGRGDSQGHTGSAVPLGSEWGTVRGRAWAAAGDSLARSLWWGTRWVGALPMAYSIYNRL